MDLAGETDVTPYFAAASLLSTSALFVWAKTMSSNIPRDLNNMRLAVEIKLRMNILARMKGGGAVSLWYKRLKQTPDKKASVFINDDGTSVSLTFMEIESMSNQIAHWAVERGLQPNDVVAINLENSVEYPCVWLGLAKVGVISSLINTHTSGTALAHALAVCKAKHAIFSPTLLEKAEGASECEKWVLQTPFTGTPRHTEPFHTLDLSKYPTSNIPSELWRQVMPTEPLFYIYTSGTTGLPKASIVDHVKWVSAGFVWAKLYWFHNEERIYCPLPLYHSAAGIIGMSLSWNNGYTFITRRKFSASNYWKDCVTHDVTAVQYIGELCRYLLATPESEYEKKHKVKVAYGNGLRVDIWMQFQQRFGIEYIGEFYGATEGNATLWNPYNKTGAMGYISPFIRLLYPVRIAKFDVEKEELIRGPKGLCVECKPGEKGELLGLINADPTRIFRGYTDAQSTEKKIVKNVFKHGDSWFRSGDIVMRDQEGFVYFVDRIGDTFRWKGENVATNEVSEIMTKIPGLQEANVYGVTIPQCDGRAGMASVVLKPGCELDLESVYNIVARDLPSYAAPIFLRVQKEMEVTTTLKHRKVELVKEGFNPHVVTDPLYFRDDRQKKYVQMTGDLHAQIVSGHMRL